MARYCTFSRAFERPKGKIPEATSTAGINLQSDDIINSHRVGKFSTVSNRWIRNFTFCVHVTPENSNNMTNRSIYLTKRRLCRQLCRQRRLRNVWTLNVKIIRTSTMLSRTSATSLIWTPSVRFNKSPTTGTS